MQSGLNLECSTDGMGGVLEGYEFMSRTSDGI